MDAQLPKPECRGEGLGLPTGQDILPSLRSGVVGGVGEWEGSGRRGESGNFEWYYL